MKIAFPVKEDNGLASIMDDHFGRAKKFLIVDSDTRDIEQKDNPKMLPDGSDCKTGIFNKKDGVHAVVTQCLGDGAHRTLMSSGIKVYKADKATIGENLMLFEKDELKRFHIFDFCQTKRNKKEGGCGHSH